MNSSPPVSVVMGVLNGLPHAEAAVRSVLAQTFTDFEFVIGDDGSTDGTSELLHRLAGEDSRIRLLRRDTPSGLAGSANWVVGASRAPLVAMMHADDLSHPERLARQVQLFAAQPEAQLIGILVNGIDDKGREVRGSDFWRLAQGTVFAPFAHSSVMFRRDAFDRAGGYRAEAEYWEDLDLYLRIAERGRVLVIPEALVSVRFSEGSARLTSETDEVDEAIDRMYRAVGSYLRGGSYPREFPAALPPGAKLLPETYVGRGSVQLWSGRSPGLLGRMLRRADLRLDLVSLGVLAWSVWATVSPRSMRFALRTAMRWRARRAEAELACKPYVEWDPRRARRVWPDGATAEDRPVSASG